MNNTKKWKMWHRGIEEAKIQVLGNKDVKSEDSEDAAVSWYLVN